MFIDARPAVSIFFPQYKTLGCDVDQLQTPAVLRKVSIASARDRSYRRASDNLGDLAELSVDAKQCQRVAIRIGNERIDEQTERIKEYQGASIPQQQHDQGSKAPANTWSGRVAVVELDGGRTQIRDELWGKDKPADKKHRWWRETQCGVLQTYLSGPSEDDPHPEIPPELMDPLWVVPKLNEIHRQHVASDASSRESEQEDSSDDAAESEPSSQTRCGETAEQACAQNDCDGNSKEEAKRWSGGPPLVKTVVATRRGYEHLGETMAAEAYHRGFNKARSKACIADGLKVNWVLWGRHFSHYTPITDLMHALSYVYCAAVSTAATIEDGWETYLEWLGLVWAGDVASVLEAMRMLSQTDAGREDESLGRAITYLSNNASRMRYDEYRRAGLPITSSLVESTQKQINWRIKGTEKFWVDEHIEPLLQLIADDLSDTHDRSAFWERRKKRFQGFRQRRAKT
jgi:hypothetical protein